MKARAIFGFLLALLIAVAPVAADGAATKGGVWMTKDPYCGGLHLAQRPSGFALTCDPVAFVEKVKWSSWGGSQAKATGVLNVAERGGSASGHLRGADRRLAADRLRDPSRL